MKSDKVSKELLSYFVSTVMTPMITTMSNQFGINIVNIMTERIKIFLDDIQLFSHNDQLPSSKKIIPSGNLPSDRTFEGFMKRVNEKPNERTNNTLLPNY